MDDYQTEIVNRLERKVDLLTWVVLIQTVLIGLGVVTYLMQIARYVVLGLVIAVPLLFFFRGSLPTIVRTLAQICYRVDRLLRHKVRERPTHSNR